MPNLIIAVAKSPRYGERNIAASYYHSLVAEQRKVFAWGFGLYGQLGNNSATDRCTPVQVCGNYCFCKVAVGENTSFGIDMNGQAYAWGLGERGQRGDNTLTAFVSTPVAVAGPYTFCEISSRNGTTVALTNTGMAYSWGWPIAGSLGNNTVNSASSPVAVCCNYTFCKISVGQQELCGLTNLGAAYCWGTGFFGSIGNNSILDRCVPTAVCMGGLNFCQLAVGNSNVIALTSTGLAYCWGQGFYGELGDNTNINRSTPVAVCGGLSFSSVGAGMSNTFAITHAGVLYSWGDNIFGTLGDNTATNKSTPVAVCVPGGAAVSFCRVTAGEYHAIATDNVGRVYAWGINIAPYLDNNLGQMLPVCCNYTLCNVAAGQYTTIATNNNNVPYSWGNNASGQVGDNSVTDDYSPTAVCGNLSFCVVTMGIVHGCGITSAGVAYCWGSNGAGRLGNNSTVSVSTPVAVCDALNFSRISAGANHTCASTNLGVLYCWGNGLSGRLGDNSVVSKSRPVAVCGAARTYCNVNVGSGYALAVTNTGALYSWGSNINGCLGNNSTVSVSTPVAVCGGALNYCIIDVSLANNFAAAITNTGAAYMWGTNTNGRLGNNSIVSVSTPVAVCGGLNFCQIALGYTHTMAITNTGVLYGWGGNLYGQLGNTFWFDYSTPVAVCGALTFCRVAAGDGWTIAITNTGVAYAWGQNQFGQLGGFRAYTPTLISFL